jgi:hypothetical protein
MNIKAIIHEAEEGGFWAQVPAIPGCATQGGKSSSPICMKRLKGASAPRFPRRSPAGGRRTSPFEICYRQSLCPLCRAARLGSAARQRQPDGKEGSFVQLSVPIHGNAPLKTGLLRHLMKLAEISEDELGVAEHGTLIRLLSRIPTDSQFGLLPGNCASSSKKATSQQPVVCSNVNLVQFDIFVAQSFRKRIDASAIKKPHRDPGSRLSFSFGFSN